MSKKVAKCDMRSDATKMKGSVAAKMRAGQKNVANRNRHLEAGTHWFVLSAEKIYAPRLYDLH